MTNDGHRYSDALVLATQHELDAIKSLEALVKGYTELEKPPRPLCIAVFGAPGSGKSRTVKALVKALGLGDGDHRKLNLTQLASVEQLDAQLNVALAGSESGPVPVVFFDEFDAPKDGTPLGWLPWFLAPMEDGRRFSSGSWHDCSRAVFVFAGGTAHRAADFGIHDPASFRAAKGPDFVSRLRGFLDVLGPNDGSDEERRFRRERAITYQLTKGLTAGGPPIEATPALLESLHAVGRFLHGDRSIGAVLELSVHGRATAPDPADRLRPLDLQHLPPDHILALHVDSGPLDPARIGGAIGMSCNFDDDSSGDAMKALAHDLWRQGARLAYFRGSAKTDAFAWAPTEHARAQPSFLSRNRLAVRRVATFVVGSAADEPEASDAVEVVRVPGHGMETWGDDPALALAELFRVRWMMNSRCVARVLVAGKVDVSPGRRVQGILEEAMLALATGQPVYVLGAFGGAARYLGGLLGLATRAVPDSLPAGEGDLPEHVATLGGALDLPTRGAQIPDYLTSFALGGPRWPANGLSVDENRELFESTSPEAITRLIRTGLLRTFGP